MQVKILQNNPPLCKKTIDISFEFILCKNKFSTHFYEKLIFTRAMQVSKSNPHHVKTP